MEIEEKTVQRRKSLNKNREVRREEKRCHIKTAKKGREKSNLSRFIEERRNEYMEHGEDHD